MTWSGPMWKTKTIKRAKGRKKRAERKVVKPVRAECVTRDGYCRVKKDGFWNDATPRCDGKSEWAHLPGWTRAQTRGRSPVERHAAAHSLMLCKKHHDQLDGRRTPRIVPDFVDGAEVGANGTIKWSHK